MEGSGIVVGGSVVVDVSTVVKGSGSVVVTG